MANTVADARQPGALWDALHGAFGAQARRDANAAYSGARRALLTQLDDVVVDDALERSAKAFRWNPERPEPKEFKAYASRAARRREGKQKKREASARDRYGATSGEGDGRIEDENGQPVAVLVPRGHDARRRAARRKPGKLERERGFALVRLQGSLASHASYFVGNRRLFRDSEVELSIYRVMRGMIQSFCQECGLEAVRPLDEFQCEMVAYRRRSMRLEQNGDLSVRGSGPKRWDRETGLVPDESGKGLVAVRDPARVVFRFANGRKILAHDYEQEGRRDEAAERLARRALALFGFDSVTLNAAHRPQARLDHATMERAVRALERADVTPAEPKRGRTGRPSKVSPFKAWIRKQLAVHPEETASALLAEATRNGYTGGRSQFLQAVKQIRDALNRE